MLQKFDRVRQNLEPGLEPGFESGFEFESEVRSPTLLQELALQVEVENGNDFKRLF